MKFGFVSEGGTLWLWERLALEGYEVGVLHADPEHKDIGKGYDGIRQFSGLSALVNWVGKQGVFIFDETSEESQTIKLGPTAQALHRAGFYTVGGGIVSDRLEMDRGYGQAIAKSCGLLLPPSKSFTSLSAAAKYLDTQEPDKNFHFKLDKPIGCHTTCSGNAAVLARHVEYLREKYGDNLANHLEDTISGPGLSVNGWFNGEKFLRPLQWTIEHKRFLDGELGPNTGCSYNYCGALVEQYEKQFCVTALESKLKELGALPGIYDINTIITKEGAYFLEWTPRFGYDSETTIMSQLSDKGDFLQAVATGLGERTEWWGYSLGVRVSVPPYPTDAVKEKQNAKGTPIIGRSESSAYFAPYGLCQTKNMEASVADPNGLVGVGLDTRTARDPQAANDEVLGFIQNELSIPGIQYRKDAGLTILTDLAELERNGVIL